MHPAPLPGDLVVSPDDAAALTADAAGWKVLTLSPEDAGRVDMVIVGALPNLVELPAPPAFAASGDSLALRDQEGVLIAVMGVTSVVEGGVRGEVAGIRRPTRPDHHDLWRAPAPYASRSRRPDRHDSPAAQPSWTHSRDRSSCWCSPARTRSTRCTTAASPAGAS